VDLRGYVIGINTAIYTPTGAFAGIGFAVPANAAREFIEEMVTLTRIKPNLKAAFMNAATKIAPPIQAGAKMPHPYIGPCVNCHTIIPSNLPPDRQMAGGNRFVVGPGGAVGMNIAITTVALTQQAAGAAGLWLGAEVQPIDMVVAKYFKSPTTYGVFINSVYQGSPAERAGLMSGDIIFKMDGRWVYSTKDLVKRIAVYSRGDEVRLSIVRNGKKQDVYLEVGAMPGNLTPALMPNPGKTPKTAQPVMLNQAMQQQPRLAMPPGGAMVPKEFEWLGMEFDPIKPAIVRDHPRLAGKKGALVVEVSPGTKAAMAGIRPRDIILSINRIPVGSPKALNDAINSARPSDGVLLAIERNNKLMYTVIQ
jgi:S1-C subfamily serine protease